MIYATLCATTAGHRWSQRRPATVATGALSTGGAPATRLVWVRTCDRCGAVETTAPSTADAYAVRT